MTQARHGFNDTPGLDRLHYSTLRKNFVRNGTLPMDQSRASFTINEYAPRIYLMEFMAIRLAYGTYLRFDALGKKSCEARNAV